MASECWCKLFSCLASVRNRRWGHHSQWIEFQDFQHRGFESSQCIQPILTHSQVVPVDPGNCSKKLVWIISKTDMPWLSNCLNSILACCSPSCFSAAIRLSSSLFVFAPLAHVHSQTSQVGHSLDFMDTSASFLVASPESWAFDLQHLAHPRN